MLFLTCPCGVETRTLKQLLAHQEAAHGVGERSYATRVRDDVSWRDEDAFKRADL